MGWRRDGWIARGRALENLWKLDPERRYNVLEEVIETLNEEGRLHAAQAFLDAQFAAAREASRMRGASDLPVFAALNGWEIAWTARDAGRAQQALRQAILSLREVASGSENRERLEREVALARSWMQKDDGDTALRNLLSFYQRHGEGEQLDALKHLQLRVAMDLTRNERGNLRSHLEAALSKAGAIAGWAVNPDQTRSLQRRRRWLWARLIELESAIDGRQGLLAVVRAREPVSGALPNPTRELALRQIQATLPHDATLLVHFSVEQGTFGWLVDEGRLQSWRSPVGAFELGQLATALRSAAANADEETFRRTAARLGKALLPPSGWGHPGAELFVVTDEVTTGIAFSTLVDPATGRSLLDDHAVAVQSQMGQLPTVWQNPAVTSMGSVAVFAAPDLDPAAFPDLVPLPFARSEGGGDRPTVPAVGETDRWVRLLEYAGVRVSLCSGHTPRNARSRTPRGEQSWPRTRHRGRRYPRRRRREAAWAPGSRRRTHGLPECGSGRGGPWLKQRHAGIPRCRQRLGRRLALASGRPPIEYAVVALSSRAVARQGPRSGTTCGTTRPARPIRLRVTGDLVGISSLRG